MKKKTKLKDICQQDGQLAKIDTADLMPLPFPYDKPDQEPQPKLLTLEQKQTYDEEFRKILLRAGMEDHLHIHEGVYHIKSSV